MNKGSISIRRTKAIESFKNATECIGKVEKNMALFAITRGQFSMIDATLAVLDQIGSAKMSIWTWVIADYEIECINRLMIDKRISNGLLMIDKIAKNKNADLLTKWRSVFGSESIRYVCNHSKIVTLENDNYKVLLRGSMNLNFNPRFEQLDITEGGEDFNLVKQIELELPILHETCSIEDITKASKLNNSFNSQQLELFSGIKVWNK